MLQNEFIFVCWVPVNEHKSSKSTERWMQDVRCRTQNARRRTQEGKALQDSDANWISQSGNCLRINVTYEVSLVAVPSDCCHCFKIIFRGLRCCYVLLRASCFVLLHSDFYTTWSNLWSSCSYLFRCCIFIDTKWIFYYSGLFILLHWNFFIYILMNIQLRSSKNDVFSKILWFRIQYFNHAS